MDYGEVVLIGVCLLLEDVGNLRCRYFEIIYYKDFVELVNIFLRMVLGFDYFLYIGILKEEDRI